MDKELIEEFEDVLINKCMTVERTLKSLQTLCVGNILEMAYINKSIDDVGEMLKVVKKVQKSFYIGDKSG